MSLSWEWIFIALYVTSLLFIFLFSLGQLHVTILYLKSKKQQKQGKLPISEFPKVCIQLPVFNERYVIERLIRTVIQIEYPKECLEIQVLDDSTDETTQIIDRLIHEDQLKQFNIQHIRRPERKDFKAGALAYGMEITEADFIAIFDADFTPDKDFLKATIPYFEEPEIGVVQTRWTHINKNYSLFTELQAFGLDAHFTIEQGGRSAAASFINFNGTAGVWRKKTIEDAGGWSADTLTEDLDLSYRAQLKGWKFKYVEDVESPAELPILMPAIKSQQFRWNKGGAETARKNLGKVLLAPLSFKQKFHAFFHLLNSSIFIAILLSAVISIPMLWWKAENSQLKILFNIGSIFLLGFLAIAYFYFIAIKQLHKKPLRYFIAKFPLFLTVSMGLSLHNAIAVSEGLLGFKSAFIRTPKFNISSAKQSWKSNQYIKLQFSWLTLFEFLLALYFGFGLYLGYLIQDFGLFIFHFMLMCGFLTVAFQSVKPKLI